MVKPGILTSTAMTTQIVRKEDRIQALENPVMFTPLEVKPNPTTNQKLKAFLGQSM
jgi:hypothetical protein